MNPGQWQHSPLCSGNGIAPNPGCSCGLVPWLYREAERNADGAALPAPEVQETLDILLPLRQRIATMRSPHDRLGSITELEGRAIERLALFVIESGAALPAPEPPASSTFNVPVMESVMIGIEQAKRNEGAALPAEHAPPDTCPTCGAPARYLAIPHPDGEGTTIPLPHGAFGGKWYHDCAARPALAGRGEQIIEIDEDGKVHGDARNIVRDPEGTYE